jgi:transposase
MMLEIGRVDRFPTAAHLASYAGLVPRVHSNGGHTRMGQGGVRSAFRHGKHPAAAPAPNSGVEVYILD